MRFLSRKVKDSKDVRGYTVGEVVLGYPGCNYQPQTPSVYLAPWWRTGVGSGEQESPWKPGPDYNLVPDEGLSLQLFLYGWLTYYAGNLGPTSIRTYRPRISLPLCVGVERRKGRW